MQDAPQRFFDFGVFRVDVAERRLLREGRSVAITSKAFDLLVTLLENAGRTLSKDELIRIVWADTFVEEGNLNHHISILRKALGDDRKNQQLIKTLPKHGYR